MSIIKKAVAIALLLEVIFSFVSQTDADPNLHLVKLTDPNALCLDGTPAAYYISAGGDPKKIYLEFEGGGWCTGPNSIS